MPRRKVEYFFLVLICALASAVLLSSHHSLFGASFGESRRAQLSRTAAQPSPFQPPADLVLTNGKVYTGLVAEPWASAVALRGEFVVAISGVAIGGAGADSDAQIKSWLGPKTRVIDLHGQFAMPGFNDAHFHLAAGAYVKLEVDLRGTKSVEDFQQRSSRAAQRIWAGRMDYRSRVGSHAVACEEIPQPAGSRRDLERASDI